MGFTTANVENSWQHKCDRQTQIDNGSDVYVLFCQVFVHVLSLIFGCLPAHQLVTHHVVLPDPQRPPSGFVFP